MAKDLPQPEEGSNPFGDMLGIVFSGTSGASAVMVLR